MLHPLYDLGRGSMAEDVRIPQSFVKRTYERRLMISAATATVAGRLEIWNQFSAVDWINTFRSTGGQWCGSI